MMIQLRHSVNKFFYIEGQNWLYIIRPWVILHVHILSLHGFWHEECRISVYLSMHPQLYMYFNTTSHSFINSPFLCSLCIPVSAEYMDLKNYIMELKVLHHPSPPLQLYSAHAALWCLTLVSVNVYYIVGGWTLSSALGTSDDLRSMTCTMWPKRMHQRSWGWN